jgi:glycosyltransferase involved in cell wall biosynthesis
MRDYQDLSSTEVRILLALYNGGPNLSAQLESFSSQTHSNWRLAVQDDGSDDDGPDQARRFAQTVENYVAVFQDGQRRGAAQNFLALLRREADADCYVALSDQDDVWFPDKLERSLRALSEIEEGQPAIFCSSTVVCDATLNGRKSSMICRRPPNFRNALIQSLAGGNTMMLNPAATRLIAAASLEAPDAQFHDWWIYQIVSGVGGEIIYDAAPTLLYRQHQSNFIGANISWRSKLFRIGKLLEGRFRDWNRSNLAALENSTHRFTPENRETLETFKKAREGRLDQRLKALIQSGVYRQTLSGSLSLYVAVLLNKL